MKQRRGLVRIFGGPHHGSHVQRAISVYPPEHFPVSSFALEVVKALVKRGCGERVTEIDTVSFESLC
jgi:hypothetical protein